MPVPINHVLSTTEHPVILYNMEHHAPDLLRGHLQLLPLTHMAMQTETKGFCPRNVVSLPCAETVQHHCWCRHRHLLVMSSSALAHVQERSELPVFPKPLGHSDQTRTMASWLLSTHRLPRFVNASALFWPSCLMVIVPFYSKALSSVSC